MEGLCPCVSAAAPFRATLIKMHRKIALASAPLPWPVSRPSFFPDADCGKTLKIHPPDAGTHCSARGMSVFRRSRPYGKSPTGFFLPLKRITSHGFSGRETQEAAYQFFFSRIQSRRVFRSSTIWVNHSTMAGS